MDYFIFYIQSNFTLAGNADLRYNKATGNIGLK
jgi:hypothetical protein